MGVGLMDDNKKYFEFNEFMKGYEFFDNTENGDTYIQNKIKYTQNELFDRFEDEITHKLKITQKFYYDIKLNGKRFELRKDDRGFEVGDKLLLREYVILEYTGREIKTEITYILRNCEKYGLKAGYAILGIKTYDS